MTMAAHRSWVMGFLSVAATAVDVLTSQELPVTTVIQSGHKGSVNAVAFSPDGRLVLTGSSDNTAKLWDAVTGSEIRTWRHTDKVNAVTFSHSGLYAATGSSDGTVGLWHVESGERIRPLGSGTIPVLEVKFSPDDSKVLIGGGRTVYEGTKLFFGEVWDMPSGRRLSTLSDPSLRDNLRAADFSADGKRIVLTDGRSIIQCDPVNGRVVHKTDQGGPLKAEGNNFTSVVFAQGSIVSANSGPVTLAGKSMSTMKPSSAFSLNTFCDLQVWSGSLEQELRTVRIDEYVGKIAVSPDGRYLLTTGPHPNFRPDVLFDFESTLVDLATGAIVRSFTDTADNAARPTCGSFSPDGTLIVLGMSDGTARIAEARSGRLVQTLEGQTALTSHIALSSDGRTLYSASDVHIRKWDLATGNMSHGKTRHPFPIRAMTLSRDGTLLATAGGKYVVKPSGLSQSFFDIRVWDTRSWLETCTLSNVPEDQQIPLDAGARTSRGSFWFWAYYFGAYSREENALTLAFTPDNLRLVSGCYGGALSVWDLATRKEIRTFKDSRWVQSVALDTAGTTLAAGFGKYVSDGAEKGQVRLWRVGDWKELRIHDPPPAESIVPSVSLSPDGRYFAAGINEYANLTWSSWTWKIKGSRADVWEITTGRKTSTLPTDGIQSVAYAPDGRHLFIGETGGSGKLWSVANRNILRAVDGARCEFALSTDRLVSLSKDGYVVLSNSASGEELVRFISVGTADFAILTPDHYYMTSKGALKGFHFSRGLRTYSFDNFDLLFNRPDIVVQRLGIADTSLVASYHRAYLKRLKRLGFSVEQIGTDMHLPHVDLVTKDLPRETAERILSFEIRASDSLYLLDRINVYVNDVPVHGLGGISLRDRALSGVSRLLDIELGAGKNKVQVSVHNQRGVESLKQTFEVTCAAKAAPVLYAVVIGVSDYTTDEFDLRYAAKDADDLASLLESRPNTRVLRILDKDATRETILKARDFLMRSGVDDQAVLFAAGHGLLDDNLDWYFATYDVDFNAPSERGLAYDELERLLDGIPARRRLMLMDACHSGEVDKEENVLVAAAGTENGSVKSRAFKMKTVARKSLGLENSFELMQQLFADLNKGTGAMVISSAGGAEYAYESADWHNGVFTYSLLDGLRSGKADANRDERITVTELRDYVAESVHKLTQGKQHPTSRKENLEFDFTVW
jgi:WD40 repeat protein